MPSVLIIYYFIIESIKLKQSILLVQRGLWFWTEVFCKYLLFVDNLEEETNNIIQINRNVRLWKTIYSLFAVHVNLLKLKGNTS